MILRVNFVELSASTDRKLSLKTSFLPPLKNNQYRQTLITKFSQNAVKLINYTAPVKKRKKTRSNNRPLGHQSGKLPKKKLSHARPQRSLGSSKGRINRPAGSPEEKNRPEANSNRLLPALSRGGRL